MKDLKVMKKQKLNEDFKHWEDNAVQYGYNKKQFVTIIKRGDIVDIFCSRVYDYDYSTTDMSNYDKVVELVKNYNGSFLNLKNIINKNLGGI